MAPFCPSFEWFLTPRYPPILAVFSCFQGVPWGIVEKVQNSWGWGETDFRPKGAKRPLKVPREPPSRLLPHFRRNSCQTRGLAWKSPLSVLLILSVFCGLPIAIVSRVGLTSISFGFVYPRGKLKIVPYVHISKIKWWKARMVSIVTKSYFGYKVNKSLFNQNFHFCWQINRISEF